MFGNLVVQKLAVSGQVYIFVFSVFPRIYIVVYEHLKLAECKGLGSRPILLFKAPIFGPKRKEKVCPGKSNPTYRLG